MRGDEETKAVDDWFRWLPHRLDMGSAGLAVKAAVGYHRGRNFLIISTKKQGATGITTVAPYVTGLWGRGMTGCRDDAQAPGVVPASAKFSCTRLSDSRLPNPDIPFALSC
jgi:hypothetical protein